MPRKELIVYAFVKCVFTQYLLRHVPNLFIELRYGFKTLETSHYMFQHSFFFLSTICNQRIRWRRLKILKRIGWCQFKILTYPLQDLLELKEEVD